MSQRSSKANRNKFLLYEALTFSVLRYKAGPWHTDSLLVFATQAAHRQDTPLKIARLSKRSDGLSLRNIEPQPLS